MDVYVGRQPILDKKQNTVAYELLFRDGFKNKMNTNIDGYYATQKVLSDIITSIGLNKIIGNKKGFINFTQGNIENGDVSVLPPEIMVVEILENTKPTESLLKACWALKKKGYKFALDDFVFKEQYRPFLDLADIVKIDFRITNTIAERKKMRSIIPSHIKLLAEKVETREEYRQALTFGYELFQGYFFCEPAIISQKASKVDISAQLSLLREMNKSDVDINHISQIIQRNVSLVHKLLRYMNSSYIGLRHHIHNIKQAIALLGLNGLRSWVNLVCMHDLSMEKPDELFVVPLIRAKFCEIVAENLTTQKLEKETAFLTGMLSLSDVIMEQPMGKVVDDLALASEVKNALLFHENGYGQLLNLILNYEQGNLEKVETWCQQNKFSTKLLISLYTKVIQWSVLMNEV